MVMIAAIFTEHSFSVRNCVKYFTWCIFLYPWAGGTTFPFYRWYKVNQLVVLWLKCHNSHSTKCWLNRKDVAVQVLLLPSLSLSMCFLPFFLEYLSKAYKYICAWKWARHKKATMIPSRPLGLIKWGFSGRLQSPPLGEFMTQQHPLLPQKQVAYGLSTPPSSSN